MQREALPNMCSRAVMGRTAIIIRKITLRTYVARKRSLVRASYMYCMYIHTNTKSNYKTSLRHSPVTVVQTLIGIPLFYVCTEYDSTHKKPYTQLPGSRIFYSFRELKHTKPLPSGQREKQTAPKTRYITKSQRGRERKALPFQLSYCPHLGECLCSVWPIERHLHMLTRK